MTSLKAVKAVKAVRAVRAVPILAMFGGLLLAACQDGPVEPRRPAQPLIVRSAAGGCGGGMPTSASLAAPQSASGIPRLGGVTVVANYFGGGVPFGMQQMMNFPAGTDTRPSPCMNDGGSSFADGGASPPLDTISVPAGVDPDFWRSLSPREQHVLYEKALALMNLFPNRYASVGAAIGALIQKVTLIKVQANIRARDFYSDDVRQELLAGGIYGCMLFRGFADDPNWILLRDETLRFSADLVTAFAESRFSHSLLRALAMGRNGARGVGLAYADGYNQECGRLAFNAVGSGGMTVADPYAQTEPDGFGRPPRPFPPPIWEF